MEVDDDEEEEEEADEEDVLGDSIAKRRMEDAETKEEAKVRVEKMELGGVNDVRNVARLIKELEPLLNASLSPDPSAPLHSVHIFESSSDLWPVLQKIAHYQGLPPDKQTRNFGNIEDNPEYQLLTRSNTLSTSIDSEIILVHKFIRDHYSVRFPELETLVANPLDYAKTVAIIGNGPMEDIRSIITSSDNLVGQPLDKVVERATLMTVTLEATRTRGQPLSDSELATVMRACEMTIQLDRAKYSLTEYVQSRMTLFAPNLTAIIGSLTAAQLINYAGGIKGLAKTPSCNIAPLGSKKQAQAGWATNVGIRHQGFLYNSDIIKGIPSDLKKQALRIVSAKVVLAARIDSAHQSPNGTMGEDLKQACLDRLDKLTEAAPNKGPRALPAPDDKPSRKRGGRRARKTKEATAMTDLRKAQNRMEFGKEEAEVGYGAGDGTKGLGMIGQQNTGQIRTQQIDQRTRAKLSKKNPGWGGATTALHGQGGGGGAGGMASSVRVGGNATMLRMTAGGLRTSGVGVGGGGAAGTASTIAFTPVQGLELVDPRARDEALRKRKAEEDRWFQGGTFTQVGAAGAGGEAKIDAAGFKVPGLPVKKARMEG
ncbi:hypothetical protein LTR28_005853 [Elasticomyces elasticus]|nr:hypothetical protein LTR28_005853 [Elasticomyces elasticus]